MALCALTVFGASAPALGADAPASPIPVPIIKPERAPGALLPVLECTNSTIFAARVPGNDARRFMARIRPDFYREELAKGCTMVRLGCNTCAVRYYGCDEDAKRACTDGDCLAKACKQRVICTAKRCESWAEEIPPCEARFARTGCEASALKNSQAAATY